MTTNYKVGDTVKFDGNFYGVNPRIGFATILEVKRGMATHGNTNPGKVLKVKGELGNTFHIDEQQIIS